MPSSLGLAGLALGGRPGLCPDAGQVHSGESFSPGLGFREGLLHRHLRVGGAGPAGELSLQALLVGQSVVPGVEILRSGVELGVAVGDH